MSIQIRNLCKSFQDNQVLRNVNLDVREKEIVVLMGLSGKRQDYAAALSL